MRFWIWTLCIAPLFAEEESRPNLAEHLLEDRDHGETTHFSVVDKDGMAVSVTSSIDYYFGSRAASPELGFLYNNYMQTFELAPGETFSLALNFF